MDLVSKRIFVIMSSEESKSTFHVCQSNIDSVLFFLPDFSFHCLILSTARSITSSMIQVVSGAKPTSNCFSLSVMPILIQATTRHRVFVSVFLFTVGYIKNIRNLIIVRWWSSRRWLYSVLQFGWYTLVSDFHSYGYCLCRPADMPLHAWSTWAPFWCSQADTTVLTGYSFPRLDSASLSTYWACCLHWCGLGRLPRHSRLDLWLRGVPQWQPSVLVFQASAHSLPV
jgi:hypothetical protein